MLRRSWAGCVLHADWLSTFWWLQRQLPMQTAQSQTHGHDIPWYPNLFGYQKNAGKLFYCYDLLCYTYFALNLIASIRNWDLCMSMKNHLLSVSLSPAFLHRSVPCHVLKNVPQCPASVAAICRHGSCTERSYSAPLNEANYRSGFHPAEVNSSAEQEHGQTNYDDMDKICRHVT